MIRILTASALLLTGTAASAQDWTPAQCAASLERAYSFFSARAGTQVQGELNGDGRVDHALLLDHRARPDRSVIGVCLSGEPRPLLITDPYASTRIAITPHGAEYHDAQAGNAGRFELDAITVGDADDARASYILRVGVFERIVHAE